MIANKLSTTLFSTYCAITTAILLPACATVRPHSGNPDIGESTNAPNTQNQGPSGDNFQEVPSAPNDPSKFSADLVASMGSTVVQCGSEAELNLRVTWTCAPFTQGLDSFMKSWDTVAKSAFFSNIHDYEPISDWMYFEIDGEVDFFWKSYKLKSTQALVTYDPSEEGKELIVGLHSSIAYRMAVAQGSHALTDEARSLPIQD